MFLKILILTTFCVIVNAKVTYDDHKVYKVIPNTKEQVDGLNKFIGSSGIEFWTEDFRLNSDVRIMVSPKRRDLFVKELKDMGLVGIELITNVQELVDQQLTTAPRTARSERLGSFDWDSYHTLEEIYDWLDELEIMYPNIVTVVSMGRSAEGRDIKGIIIDYNPGREERYVGMLEGTIHAREWISPATVTWIIKEFLTSTNSDVIALARHIVWHIFPVVNPDGYTYSFTDVRMWRKNRNEKYYKDCGPNIDNDLSRGVDLNRNFDFVWGTHGASDDPCTNLFIGPVPSSEPETLAIVNYVNRIANQGKLVYYLGFHSFTQLLVVPFSHLTGEEVLQVENYGDMFEAASHAADAIKERFGTQYRVGVADDVLYKMSGTSFDWVKNATDASMCFLVELRDLGYYGFLLPPDQIIPNNLEVMDGLVRMDAVVRRMGYYEGGAASVLVSVTLLSLSVIAGFLFK